MPFKYETIYVSTGIRHMNMFVQRIIDGHDKVYFSKVISSFFKIVLQENAISSHLGGIWTHF